MIFKMADKMKNTKNINISSLLHTYMALKSKIRLN